ncbi:hypothetical protein B566_EDAN008584 [Ephemera danica]|nr:hypothetical protein B566_EDAN008584 [Ephemera danica]
MRPITSMGTPARPCFNILSSARDEMYTCSAVSTTGASFGGGGACDKPGTLPPSRSKRSISAQSTWIFGAICWSHQRLANIMSPPLSPRSSKSLTLLGLLLLCCVPQPATQAQFPNNDKTNQSFEFPLKKLQVTDLALATARCPPAANLHNSLLSERTMLFSRLIVVAKLPTGFTFVTRHTPKYNVASV